MKRVDVFLPKKSQYGVLEQFTKSVCEALGRRGLEVRVLPEKGEKALACLLKDPPLFTLAFNGILPSEGGICLADQLEIPHAACLVDSAYHYFPLAKSRWTWLGCDDRSNLPLFSDLGAAHVGFLPHGVDRSRFAYYDLERPLDVLFLGSLIDFEGVREEWKRRFAPEDAAAMDGAVELAFSHRSRPLPHCVMGAFQECERPLQLEALHLVEQYVRGKERVDLLRALDEQEVHILGQAPQGRSWKRQWETGRYIFHESVSYEDSFSWMQKAKVILNSCPRIRQGGHERLFGGIASGGLVLTHSDSFLEETFTEGQSLAFFRSDRLGEVGDLVSSFINQREVRWGVVRAGQEVVREHHTWDRRVETLLQGMVASGWAPEGT